MKAKETVQDFDNTILSTVNSLLEAQAEASFKAGIMEVVEWLDSHCAHGGVYSAEQMLTYMFVVSKEQWQAKLEEWEIK